VWVIIGLPGNEVWAAIMPLDIRNRGISVYFNSFITLRDNCVYYMIFCHKNKNKYPYDLIFLEKNAKKHPFA
jgi:hypothetical protein